MLDTCIILISIMQTENCDCVKNEALQIYAKVSDTYNENVLSLLTAGNAVETLMSVIKLRTEKHSIEQPA